MPDTSLPIALWQIRTLVSAKVSEDASDQDLLDRFRERQGPETRAGREAAFVALLRRHGPMVLRVVRRAGGSEQDAEDVFQATFLLLARKADSIRKRESVAAWLHGVARHLALKARQRQTRRQAREKQAADMRKARITDEAWQELQSALDAALAGLPEKYRAPLLLCYLQGRTQEEAAKQLGCPLGTVRSRLARGRDRLRVLLERQGVRLSVTAFAAALTATSAPAAVAALPAGLMTKTMTHVLAAITGEPLTGAVTASVAELVKKGATMATMLSRTKTAMTILLAAVLLAGAGAWTYRAMMEPQSDDPEANRPEPPPLPVRDQGSLTGRVLDLQGRPVAGVTVHVLGVDMPTSGDLTAYVKGLRDQKEFFPPMQKHLRADRAAARGAPVKTGADGCFTIPGIGRDRLVHLRIAGPTVATWECYAMTRPGERVRLPGYRQFAPNTHFFTVYGNGFTHIATPLLPIVGTVRDKDTGKPIPGAVVTSYQRAGSKISSVTDLRCVADKDGHYRLEGMPKGAGNVIRAGPPETEPYLMAVKEVADTTGLESARVDFALKRGVWIRGRVLDKVTRKPVDAAVQYVVFADNPRRREVPELSVDLYGKTRGDGSFRVAALPGRGLLGARARNDRYRLAVGANSIEGLAANGLFETFPFLLPVRTYHTLVQVNPAAGAKELTCDILLDPGQEHTGQVLDPDGRPLAGARARALKSYGYWEREPLKTAEFTVTGLEANKPRLLQFVHGEKKLAGSVVVKGDEQAPINVKLLPAGTLTGRLVTPEGKPLTDGWLNSRRRAFDQPFMANEATSLGSFPNEIVLNKDGTFRIEGLAPGLTYYLGFRRGFYAHRLTGAAGGKLVLKPGEVRDLGDVMVQMRE